jgi:hypothetical protein
VSLFILKISFTVIVITHSLTVTDVSLAATLLFLVSSFLEKMQQSPMMMILERSKVKGTTTVKIENALLVRLTTNTNVVLTTKTRTIIYHP